VNSLVHHLVVVFGIERQASAQNGVGEHSKTERVYLERVRLPQENFRSNVTQGAKRIKSLFLRREDLGETKVNEFGHSFF